MLGKLGMTIFLFGFRPIFRDGTVGFREILKFFKQEPLSIYSWHPFFVLFAKKNWCGDHWDFTTKTSTKTPKNPLYQFLPFPPKENNQKPAVKSTPPPPFTKEKSTHTTWKKHKANNMNNSKNHIESSGNVQNRREWVLGCPWHFVDGL